MPTAKKLSPLFCHNKLSPTFPPGLVSHTCHDSPALHWLPDYFSPSHANTPRQIVSYLLLEEYIKSFSDFWIHSPTSSPSRGRFLPHGQAGQDSSSMPSNTRGPCRLGSNTSEVQPSSPSSISISKREHMSSGTNLRAKRCSTPPLDFTST